MHFGLNLGLAIGSLNLPVGIPAIPAVPLTLEFVDSTFTASSTASLTLTVAEAGTHIITMGGQADNAPSDFLFDGDPAEVIGFVEGTGNTPIFDRIFFLKIDVATTGAKALTWTPGAGTTFRSASTLLRAVGADLDGAVINSALSGDPLAINLAPSSGAIAFSLRRGDSNGQDIGGMPVGSGNVESLIQTSGGGAFYFDCHSADDMSGDYTISNDGDGLNPDRNVLAVLSFQSSGIEALAAVQDTVVQSMRAGQRDQTIDLASMFTGSPNEFSVASDDISIDESLDVGGGDASFNELYLDTDKLRWKSSPYFLTVTAKNAEGQTAEVSLELTVQEFDWADMIARHPGAEILVIDPTEIGKHYNTVSSSKVYLTEAGNTFEGVEALEGGGHAELITGGNPTLLVDSATFGIYHDADNDDDGMWFVPPNATENDNTAGRNIYIAGAFRHSPLGTNFGYLLTFMEGNTTLLGLGYSESNKPVMNVLSSDGVNKTQLFSSETVTQGRNGIMIGIIEETGVGDDLEMTVRSSEGGEVSTTFQTNRLPISARKMYLGCRFRNGLQQNALNGGSGVTVMFRDQVPSEDVQDLIEYFILKRSQPVISKVIFTTDPTVTMTGADEFTYNSGVLNDPLEPITSDTRTWYWNGADVTAQVVGNTWTRPTGEVGQLIVERVVENGIVPGAEHAAHAEAGLDRTGLSGTDAAPSVTTTKWAHAGIVANFSGSVSAGGYIAGRGAGHPFMVLGAESVVDWFPGYKIADGIEARALNGGMINPQQQTRLAFDGLTRSKSYDASLNAWNSLPISQADLGTRGSLVISRSDTRAEVYPKRKGISQEIIPFTACTTVPQWDEISPPDCWPIDTLAKPAFYQPTDAAIASLPTFDATGLEGLIIDDLGKTDRRHCCYRTRQDREELEQNKDYGAVRLYGREYTRDLYNRMARLMIDQTVSEKRELANNICQMGVDIYGILVSAQELRSDFTGVYESDGGHHNGRKPVVLATGKMLNHADMITRMKANVWQEDDNTSYIVEDQYLISNGLHETETWSGGWYSDNGSQAVPLGMWNNGVHPAPIWTGESDTADRSVNAYATAHPYGWAGQNNDQGWLPHLLVYAMGWEGDWQTTRTGRGNDLSYFDYQARHYHLRTSGGVDPWRFRGGVDSDYDEVQGQRKTSFTGLAYELWEREIVTSGYLLPWGDPLELVA